MGDKFRDPVVFHLELDKRMRTVNASSHPFSQLGRIRDFILVNRNLDPESLKLVGCMEELYRRQGDILFGRNEISSSVVYYRKANMSSMEIESHIRFMRQSKLLRQS